MKFFERKEYYLEPVLDALLTHCDDDFYARRRFLTAQLQVLCFPYIHDGAQSNSVGIMAQTDPELLLSFVARLWQLAPEMNERRRLFWAILGNEVDDWRRRARLFVGGGAQ